MQGNIVEGTTITWASLRTSVATVSDDGKVTAKLAGTALVVAAAAGCGSRAADTVTVHVVQEAASVELSPASLSLQVGGTGKLAATVKDAGGTVISNVQVAWAASPAGVVNVLSDGTVGGVAAGTATITASTNGKSAQATVTVSSGTVPPPPGNGADFITGPQLPLGQSPWRFFDDNQAAKAGEHHRTAMTTSGDDYRNANYYDLPLALYGLHQRSGDPAHLTMARETADRWATLLDSRGWVNDNNAPRGSGLSGMMLRALDGRPELWPNIIKLANEHYDAWLGRRLNNSTLWYGVRDGGFSLLYVAQLARVHPDSGIRNDMQKKALAAARDYYARLQDRDGGWYWDDLGEYGPAGVVNSQPFMVGILLEALIAVHQITADPVVRQSILRGVDWLWDRGYENTPITNYPPMTWRSMRYVFWRDHPEGFGEYVPRTTARDIYNIRDNRQINVMTIHAFGYAYHLTGQSIYRERGDEIFSATFGKGLGPGADEAWGLADYRAREYNQSYRSAGRYLAWR
jgi:hypothetical protein